MDTDTSSCCGSRDAPFFGCIRLQVGEASYNHSRERSLPPSSRRRSSTPQDFSSTNSNPNNKNSKHYQTAKHDQHRVEVTPPTELCLVCLNYDAVYLLW